MGTRESLLRKGLDMQRVYGLWIVLGILLSVVQGVHAADGDRKSEWPEGRQMIQTQLNGKCLDVPNAKFEAGTALQTWQCWSGNPAQVFEFTPERQIRVGGLCLNIFGGRANNGDTVGLWQCVGAPNEKWDLVDGRVVGMNGRCLDVYGGDTKNGARIIVWDCAGRAPNQLWTVVKPDSAAPTNAGAPIAPTPSADHSAPWVARSFTGPYLPLAGVAEIWSNPKPFKRPGGQTTVQSRFLFQKGTTCRFEVQFNNVGPNAVDETVMVGRPGKVAWSQYDHPIRIKLNPGASYAFGTEVRECPLNWGETKEMGKCAACEPVVYFSAQ